MACVPCRAVLFSSLLFSSLQCCEHRAASSTNRFSIRFNFTLTSAQFSLHGYWPFSNASGPPRRLMSSQRTGPACIFDLPRIERTTSFPGTRYDPGTHDFRSILHRRPFDTERVHRTVKIAMCSQTRYNYNYSEYHPTCYLDHGDIDDLNLFYPSL